MIHKGLKRIIQINFTVSLIVFFCAIYTIVYAAGIDNFGNNISSPVGPRVRLIPSCRGPQVVLFSDTRAAYRAHVLHGLWPWAPMGNSGQSPTPQRPTESHDAPWGPMRLQKNPLDCHSPTTFFFQFGFKVFFSNFCDVEFFLLRPHKVEKLNLV